MVSVRVCVCVCERECMYICVCVCVYVRVRACVHVSDGVPVCTYSVYCIDLFYIALFSALEQTHCVRM